MEIFNSIKGLVQPKEAVRDVSADLIAAKRIIEEVKGDIFVEDLIKLVQKTCSLTNDEVYILIQEVDSKLKAPIKD